MIDTDKLPPIEVDEDLTLPKVEVDKDVKLPEIEVDTDIGHYLWL